jgi:hypothetical protein
MTAGFLAVGEIGRDDGEGLLGERVDRFGDGAVVVEDILGPPADRD